METNIKPSDLQGRDICFLLDIEYAGAVFRFSTFPINIEDLAANTTIQYKGGLLSDPDINLQTQIVGFNPEQNKLSLELIFNDINWISEWTKGRVLDNAVCRLFMISVRDDKTAFYMQNRIALFSGRATGAIFGTPDRPIGHVAFTIENDLIVTDKKIIQEYQYLDYFEFNDRPEFMQGKIIPFIFGKPGPYPTPDGSDSFLFFNTQPATPCYLSYLDGVVDAFFLVAYDTVEAINLRIYSTKEGNFVNPVETALDSNNRIYSFVRYTFGASEIENNNFAVGGINEDVKYYTQWSEYDGAISNPYGDGYLEGAGDICLYALERSGLEFDYEAWIGVRNFLNKYKFAGYINDPDATWFEWLKDSIIEYLPIEIINTGKGLKPVVNLYFTSDNINPVHYVTDSGDFQIVTGLQPLDVEIINKISIYYCFDPMAEKFNSILRLRPDMDPRQTYTANSFPSQLGKISMEQYGLKEIVYEIPHLYDLDTALKIAHDKMRFSAMGALALEVSAASKFGYFELGDILSLSSEHLGFSNYKCQIVSKSWQENRWRFIIHIENNTLINPNQ